MPPWALPLPGGVNLALVLGANQRGPRQRDGAGVPACTTLSPSLGSSFGEPCSLRLVTSDPPPTALRPPAWLTGCGRQDSDGLQHLHLFPGRKCQVLQGSVGCQQRAGQDLSRAGERVTISNERCRRREGESRVPPPSPSASSIS